MIADFISSEVVSNAGDSVTVVLAVKELDIEELLESRLERYKLLM